MELVVLADTHLRGGISSLPSAVIEALGSCDRILHAGDVLDATVLAALAVFAPVDAVLGNNDHDLAGELPVERNLVLEGVRVAMVHDSGPTVGRPARMARRFPGAGLVVFGHSHVPMNEVGLTGQVLFNPGSPTQRRRQSRASFGRLQLRAGAIVSRSIELLER